MAAKKQSELSTQATLADDDTVTGIDTSAATPGAKNVNFTLAALATWVLAKVSTVSQEEAVAGSATTNRWWTAQRVAQAAAAVVAASVSGLANQWSGTRAPLGTDDGTTEGGGYAQGSLWRWGTRVWLCVSNATNIAVWVELTGGGEGGGMENPMTGAGDLIVGGEDGAATRLAPGEEGQILTVGESGPEWSAAPSGGGGMVNPMTTAGDLIVGGEEGAATRLAAGAEGKVLGVQSDAIAWVDPPSGGGGANTLYSERVIVDELLSATYYRLFAARTNILLHGWDIEVASAYNGGHVTLRVNGASPFSAGISTFQLGEISRHVGSELFPEPVAVSEGAEIGVYIEDNGDYMGSGGMAAPMEVGVEWSRA